MLAVKPGCSSSAKEKLRAVGIGASICHREDASPVVFQLEVLVVKHWPVDAFSSCAIACGEVSCMAWML